MIVLCLDFVCIACLDYVLASMPGLGKQSCPQPFKFRCRRSLAGPGRFLKQQSKHAFGLIGCFIWHARQHEYQGITRCATQFMVVGVVVSVGHGESSMHIHTGESGPWPILPVQSLDTWFELLHI